MSLTYRVLLTLLLISTSGLLSAQAQTERHYRVELIVVRHLDGVSDSAPQETLRDLTDLLDLHAPPPRPEEIEIAAEVPVEPVTADELIGTGDLQAGAEEEPEKPLAVAVEEMSDTMREAWRRLRLSAGFRPEQFRSWEQSGNSPFPKLRIHDEEILFEIDPLLETPIAPVDEYGALVFSDATMDSQSNLSMDEVNAEEELEAELPPIQYYYRIDGSAQLSRSRFLHLDIEIELREPLYDPIEELRDSSGQTPLPQNSSAIPIADNGSGLVNEAEDLIELPQKTGPAADATAFKIHRINQRRQVKTEQMEYFDGPVIGILAYITGFDVEPEVTSP